MALLKKLKIASSSQNSKFEDVPTPGLGKDAVIRVQKLRIAGQLRLNDLNKSIEEMKLKDHNQITALNITAMLMCVMVDEDGGYLVIEDDVLGTMNALDDADALFELSAANNRVNSVASESGDEKLETAKKNS